MSSTSNSDKKVALHGPELVLDMAFTAVQTLVAAGSTLTVGGKAYSQADLLKEIEAKRAPLKDARDAKVNFAKARVVVRAELPDIKSWVKELRTGVRAFVGESNPEIEKFGFAVVRPRRKLSAEENALKADRSRRTRQARHTMGAKQKETIKAAPVDTLTIHTDGASPTPAPSTPAK